MKRRHFLMGMGGGMAATLAPSWAEIAPELFLAAANTPENATWLTGLTPGGVVAFALPLPERGHAAAAHPERAEAVVFARRPGRFALVLDVASGREIARLHTPEGMHFYGHGAYSAEGRYLMTTENAYDVPAGRIGVWDAARDYVRVGDFASGGIGPHEMIRLADGRFAVANGGIQTHPDFERAKLNLPTMQTNLAILSEAGGLEQVIPLAGEMRQNSVRHIDTDPAGRIVAALQWQGAPDRSVPLVARFSLAEAPASGAAGPVFLDHPATARLKHYAGSIAVSAGGDEIAVTGPKGSHVLFLDGDGAATGDTGLGAASGVARSAGGLLITCRGGIARREGGVIETIPVAGDWRWDNHLVRVG